ncbi:MAG TPA: hypothetical protein VFX15_06650 [Actinomycetes bacterium]|nr:hypothetical protein [Actinomycetes bacterium]
MSTQLREMFEAAADDRVPPDLTQRAVDGARRRRRQRWVGGAAAATAAAFVLGVVVATTDLRSETAPRPTDVATIPTEMPMPSGLPELQAGVMSSASAAYVVDERLVLVDARSAEGYVYDGAARMDESDTGGLDAGALRPYQVSLSPDGSTALVAMRSEFSQRLLGIRLAVLDVATAESSLEDLQLSDAYAEEGWLQYNLMSWAPDSKSAYCVCLGRKGTDPQLGIWSITIGDTLEGAFYSQISKVVPSQISAGVTGLAVQLDPFGGSWEIRSDDYLNQADLGPAESLSLSGAVPTAFAAVREGRYTIDDVACDGCQVEWKQVPAGPVSSIQAFGSDYVLISRPENAAPGEPPPPTPLLAHVITADSAPRLLTTFPASTTSTSLAAQQLPSE